MLTVRVKAKVHPRTGQEGLEGEWKYSFALSWTSALDRNGCSTHTPDNLHSGKSRSPFNRTVGGSQGHAGAENLTPTENRSSDRPASSEPRNTDYVIPGRWPHATFINPSVLVGLLNTFCNTHKLHDKVITRICSDGTSSVTAENPTCDWWHLEQTECDVSCI
jgi:hypothetical protein